MPKWLSPRRRQKRVYNYTSEWNQKYKHFFPHASRSLLRIRFVAVAFRSEEEVSWRRGPPWPILAPPWNWPKNNNTCKGPWVLHPYQVLSKSIKRFWRKSRKCVPIHIHAWVHPPFLHLNKYIKNSLKFFKHLNLWYQHSPSLKHGNYTK